MQADDLERKLAAARERLQTAVANLARKHKGGEWEEYRSANSAVLRLGRELACANGEEYAHASDFPVRWDAGAPLPHVLANDHYTFLIFCLRELGSIGDGTQVIVVEPVDSRLEPLALVEFKRCAAFKMGTPNDEVLTGHPLPAKGRKRTRRRLFGTPIGLKSRKPSTRCIPIIKLISGRPGRTTFFGSMTIPTNALPSVTKSKRTKQVSPRCSRTFALVW